MTTLLAPSAIGKRTTPAPVAPQAVAAQPRGFFAPEVQAELERADHEAWTAVTSILITIVTLGLIIGIGAVLLTL